MDKGIKSFLRDKKGLTTVEYALLLALLVVVAITAWQTLGKNQSANSMAPPAVSGPAQAGGK